MIYDMDYLNYKAGDQYILTVGRYVNGVQEHKCPYCGEWTATPLIVGSCERCIAIELDIAQKHEEDTYDE